jgi:hypothetical protein
MLTRSRASVLTALRVAHDVADGFGKPERPAAFLIAVVMEALADGTEAELAEVLAAVACGPVVPGPDNRGMKR